MIGFFVIAALLVVAALLFVVPPLLGRRRQAGEVSHNQTNLAIYRDQLRELDADLASGTIDPLQHERAKLEIERRVLEEVEQEAEPTSVAGPRWTMAIVVAVGIPLLSIPLYVVVGNPAALDPAKVAAAAANEGAHEITPERIAAMVEQLRQRLAANPEDGEGWVMLAKTTAAIGRYEDSAAAYREAVKRSPENAQLLADFADTLAMAQGRSLSGEPEKLIEQALRVDPRNVKALALGGTIAFQKSDYAKAASLWQRILEIVPADSEFAQRIQGSIADAQSRVGGGVPVAKPAKATVGAAKLTGTVQIDADARKALAPTDTVFVFARAASGPKMPLAVVRLQVKDLPAAFELDESMAVAPGMSISKFPELMVGARISKSGSATPASGDWESGLLPAKLGASGLRLVVANRVQ